MSRKAGAIQANIVIPSRWEITFLVDAVQKELKISIRQRKVICPIRPYASLVHSFDLSICSMNLVSC
ncbi:hypothetical protein HN51_14150 [Ectopseudomonas mendocina]|uniref:Uncharacterized protein n=1 Tax=Ectopseudomonas mendocina S5.2 TaxID=1225174 RepID=A0ABM5VTQ8_ECTME|nr:hypothetical protein DW68_006125 [Pseudomonas mendocina S5.2]KES00950.1 hypothetical protein HN51_14150 [Pseudomonas mendocina]